MEKTISNGFFLGKVNTKNNSADRFHLNLTQLNHFEIISTIPLDQRDHTHNVYHIGIHSNATNHL